MRATAMLERTMSTNTRHSSSKRHLRPAQRGCSGRTARKPNTISSDTPRPSRIWPIASVPLSSSHMPVSARISRIGQT